MTRFRLFRYSFYRRVLLSLFVITASTILAVSVTLVFSFTRQIERDITSIARAMINQTANASDLVYRQILDIGGHLIEDRDVVNTMFGSEVDRLAEAGTARYFTSLRAVYPFINSLAIYNGRSGRYLHSTGITDASDAAFLKTVRGMVAERYLVQTPRTIVFPQPDTRAPADVITFTLRPHLYSYLPETSFIVVNVDVKYFERLLRGLSWARNESLLIVNSQGLLLASTRGYPFLADLAGQSWLQAILRSPSSQGAFTSTLEASRYLVTYQRSASFGWFFVALNPYRDFLPNVFSFRRITAVVAVALILIGAGLNT